MKSDKSKTQFLTTLTNDYGMVLVLLLLVIGFSLLTLERLDSAGAEAGREVARSIIDF